MNILALDSSGKTASVCILHGGAVAYETLLDEGLTHSQTLLPLVQKALAACGYTLADIGLLAAAAGPGSFTGLRIGLALTKGLALPGDIPAVGISTLRAIAMAAGGEGLILPALDARRGEVYWAAFACGADGACRRLLPDAAGSAAAAAAWLDGQSPFPVALVGDGASLCYNKTARRQDSAVSARRLPAYPTARGVALAAKAAWQAGKAACAAQLTPSYLRLSQAERERQAAGPSAG